MADRTPLKLEHNPSNGEYYRLNSDSNMQDGVVTITKYLYFKIPDSANIRAYSDLDVYGHANFPKRGSALPEDARYQFRGNASITHRENSRYFIAAVEYSTNDPSAQDSQGNAVTADTPPWMLKPEEVNFTYPEKKVAFRASYNATGQLYMPSTQTSANGNAIYVPVCPVANSAGDFFAAERTVRNMQMSFRYAVQDWSPSKALDYAGTINSSQVIVCGLIIPSHRALMLAPESSKIRVYDGSKVKWTYWNVNISILIDTTGELLERKFLDVGNRAYFQALDYSDALIQTPFSLRPSDLTKPPETICRMRKYIKTPMQGGYGFVPLSDEDVIISWNQFIALRSHMIQTSINLTKTDSKYKGGIIDPQCEQLSQIPLLNGYVDETAIQTKQYNSLSFREYPYKDWSGLNLPIKA